MKTMTAKYPGTCIECRRPISRGETICSVWSGSRRSGSMGREGKGFAQGTGGLNGLSNLWL